MQQQADSLESEIRDQLRPMGFDFEATPDGYAIFDEDGDCWGSKLSLGDLLEFVRDFNDWEAAE